LRGRAYAKKDDLDNAIADYNRAIELNPGHPDAYFYRGTAYLIKDDYSRVIETDPNNITAYFYRGASYCLKADLDLAIADFSSAIKLDPEDAAAYHNRGLAYYLRNEMGDDINNAIADYETALKINPDYGSAKKGLRNARLYRSRSLSERSIDDFLQEVSLADYRPAPESEETKARIAKVIQSVGTE
jgi:tetratricopeptide (TPR) repeat protein